MQPNNFTGTVTDTNNDIEAIEIIGDLIYELHHQVHVPGCKCQSAIRKLVRAQAHLTLRIKLPGRK